jgi:Tfp pilus assembly protein PilN
MIEINLLPERLKKKRKGVSLASLLQLPRETIIVLIGSILCLLILLHILLVGVLVIQKMRLSGLSRHWERIAPDKARADALKEDIAKIETKLGSFDQVASQSKKIVWAQKLNQLSDALPAGLWLTKLSLSSGVLIIEGSAISKRGEEMVLVGKFTSLLKNDAGFAKDFKDIELTSINRKLIKSVEVADFVVTALLKD